VFKKRLRVEAKERQGTRNDLEDNIPENFPESNGDSRDKAGAAVGVSDKALKNQKKFLRGR